MLLVEVEFLLGEGGLKDLEGGEDVGERFGLADKDLLLLVQEPPPETFLLVLPAVVVVPFEVEEDDGEGFGAVDAGGGVDVGVGDEGVEVVGHLGGDVDVEIGDDNPHPVRALLVDVIVDVVLPDEVPVLADAGKQQEYLLNGGHQDGLPDLVQLEPPVSHWMVDFDPLLGGLDLEEEAIEGVRLEEFDCDQALVDVDDGLVVIEGDLEDLEYFEHVAPVFLVFGEVVRHNFEEDGFYKIFAS